MFLCRGTMGWLRRHVLGPVIYAVGRNGRCIASEEPAHVDYEPPEADAATSTAIEEMMSSVLDITARHPYSRKLPNARRGCVTHAMAGHGQTGLTFLVRPGLPNNGRNEDGTPNECPVSETPADKWG